MLDPHITASAADAAVTSLCYENQCSRELFDDNDGKFFDSIASPDASNPERYLSNFLLDLTSSDKVLNIKVRLNLFLIRDADCDADNAEEDKSPNQSGIKSYVLFDSHHALLNLYCLRSYELMGLLLIYQIHDNFSEIAGISSAKNIIPLNLKTRAATATALGVAAANAMMLADKEEKEIGNLVAIMIETQVLLLR